jgi:glycosyltransferase involved in cell wall biosynthesis
MRPLVSVVVPVLNVAGLLPRCLDSLLAQTYRPLEIIVVDDGSTDGSGAVMLDYAERYPDEVHVITQRHRGLGPARNAAISIAHGEYVSMIDADDWVEPDFLEDTVAIAEETGADVVVGGFVFHMGPLKVPFPFLPRIPMLTGMEAAELSLRLTRFPSFAWNKLWRRSLFRPDDPPFPSVEYEDLATTPRILQRAGTVAMTQKVYYHYCLRSDSITGAFSAKNVFSFAAALDILRRDIHANGMWDQWHPAYRRLLREARAMMGFQVIFQRNHIPVRHRLPLLLRYNRLLRKLAHAPSDGHQLRTVRLRRSGARSSIRRRPVSATVTVARPETIDN